MQDFNTKEKINHVYLEHGTYFAHVSVMWAQFINVYFFFWGVVVDSIARKPMSLR